ncbi:MAG TPA: hypothetical protein PKA16_04275 [Ottowia sp.]|uniref:hypothetical protein n=1 Tax=Ottowia sp. TaxID=1898956 RepID=UPI002C09C061|nr:hypothetical protein [Ottowia sp.]HMN20592.1 hypothetical protein [Ottowia sp.]
MSDAARTYEFQPSFILGFHGCEKLVAEDILSGAEPHLLPSEKKYDWLGKGIYFWEGSYARAMEWARAKHRDGVIATPAVIGAVIDLRHCLDLFDSGSMAEVKRAHALLSKILDSADLKMPRNVGKTPDKAGRELDCAVMNLLLSLRDAQAKQVKGLETFDSVRGPFLEGDPIYPDAGFRQQTHIQISVRNTACIKGYFRPLV